MTWNVGDTKMDQYCSEKMQKYCDREGQKALEFDGVKDDNKINYMSKVIKLHKTIIMLNSQQTKDEVELTQYLQLAHGRILWVVIPGHPSTPTDFYSI